MHTDSDNVDSKLCVNLSENFDKSAETLSVRRRAWLIASAGAPLAAGAVSSAWPQMGIAVSLSICVSICTLSSLTLVCSLIEGALPVQDSSAQEAAAVDYSATTIHPASQDNYRGRGMQSIRDPAINRCGNRSLNSIVHRLDLVTTVMALG